MVTPAELLEQKRPAVQSSGRSRAWRRFWSYPLSTAGIVGVLFLFAFSFLGPIFYHVDPLAQNITHMLQPPSAAHPMGTDDLGRDVLSRLMVGGRSSLEVGFLSAFVAMAFGTLYGMISGLVGGWTDIILMRIVDVLLSIPSLFILLFLDVTFKPSVVLMIFVIASTSWLTVSRIVRGEVLKIKTETYVEAARLAGVGPWRLMLKYLVPNFIGTVLVTTTFSVADSILTIAGLSFLGLGLPPPAPNWGAELSESLNYIFQNSWWLIYPPGILILVSQLSVNFVGDGLRHALETRVD
ncbi:ABC transporter permease [Alicyclobacillus fastidiosus]|uniref:ABC transporter permease n=1 Tax=Alicyclobacillus fastidiosus TaxID=392011 RepID=A0ABV5A989_9BACL|nr:ABC transporter permease [Alicyclobacillus fastidiosus]WEH10782.1 ABC transporter permease [Alicyclobacillus fastidiosus]